MLNSTKNWKDIVEHAYFFSCIAAPLFQFSQPGFHKFSITKWATLTPQKKTECKEGQHTDT